MNDTRIENGRDGAVGGWRTLLAGPFWPMVAIVVFVFASAAMRPLLPPDETRYLSVAWEMMVRGNFIVPTLNFDLYAEKPPLLFWLIDLSWSLFGVSRWSALVPIAGISALVIFLTDRLSRRLFPERPMLCRRVGWLMAGNIAFVVYAGLILFDLLTTALILAATLALTDTRLSTRAGGILAGLALGLGLLAKGPVAILYALLAAIGAALFLRTERGLSSRRLASRVLLALGLSLLIISCWLVPLAIATNGELLQRLVWDQAAGRVTGTIEASHARPFWFYLVLLPVAALPWLLTIPFWQAHPLFRRQTWRRFRAALATERSLRFLVFWIVAAVLIFSLITGKQPHYLLPVLPAAVILTARAFETVALGPIRGLTLVILAVTVAGQAAFSPLLSRYDIQPLASFVADLGEDVPMAIVGSHHGELNFLARRTTPFAEIDPGEASRWLAEHPDGGLVLIGSPPLDVKAEVVFEQPYRGSRKMIVMRSAGAGDRR